MKRAAIAILTGSLVVACQSFESGAKESFGKSNTCPDDRVQVLERPDLKLSMLRSKPEPPADIKSDPDRLKMWRDKQAESDARGDKSCEIWEAKGCGKHEMLCCFRPGKHMNRISCSGSAAPPGTTKL
ncbi:MAG: hypothetical protein JST00_46640 [Deltaproteobacteria bacterium]|nr:hypothetical protein [Deltaproteobacteria bacterium]